MRDSESTALSDDRSGTEEVLFPSVPYSAGDAGWSSVLRLLVPILVLLLAYFLRVYRLPSVPFGWHPDEAVKGIMAREVLAGKAFPVFFSAFTGRDALYVYLEAAAFALFGEGMLAGRLLSAFIGVLTVALTCAVGRAMFNRRVGWLAAGLMAVSLWHLIASRNGYRAVIQPLMQLPVLWLLFRVWHTQPDSGPWCSRMWLFVGAGLFLGLTQYTYTAARIFPVLILAAVFLALVLNRTLVTRRWRPLLLMCLVAAVVVSPLVGYFLRHPVDFYGRAEQISIFAPQFSGGDPWGRLWRSVEETARMFTVWGDPNYRFNLAGRPVFGPVDGGLFYLGLLYCLLFIVWPAGRIANPTYKRVACVALFLWLLIMLVPMALSAESLPYYQRAIGALPAVYFFPALFLDALVGWAARYSGRAAGVARILCASLCIVLFAGLTARTYQAYFVAWHTAPQNDDDRRVAMVYVADYLRRVEPADTLYLSSEYGEHPTLAFLAPERYEGIHWFDARQSLPVPPQETTATYLLLLENAPQPALLARVPDLRRVDTGYDRFGRQVFEVYRWEGGALPVPGDRSPGIASWERAFEPGDPHGLRRPVDLPANFGDVMLFLGHDRSGSEVGPGETLEVVLYWRLLQRPERQYSVFVHLLDAESQVAGEFDANAYGAKYWREGGGEMLLGYYPLQVSADTPSGEYQLEIGVYHQPTGERLPVYDGSEEVAADRLLLRPVQVR